MKEKLDESPCNTIIEITAQTSLPAGIAGTCVLNIRKRASRYLRSYVERVLAVARQLRK